MFKKRYMLMALFLTTVFFFNIFNTSLDKDNDLGGHFDLFSEYLVTGKMALTDKTFLFNKGGFLGSFGNAPASRTYNFARDYSANPDKFYTDEFYVYTAQFALQGKIFSLVAKKLMPSFSTFWHKVLVLKLLTCLFLAVLITYLIKFFNDEFGGFSAILVLWSVVYSPWLIWTAKNLYWVTWTFFLPAIISLWYFKNYSDKNTNYKTIFILMFVTLLIRFLCGFEFASTVLINSELFVFYYAIKNKHSLQKFTKSFLTVAGAGLSSFITAVAMTVFMVKIFKEISFKEAFLNDFLVRVTYDTNGIFNGITKPTGWVVASLEDSKGTLFKNIEIYLTKFDYIWTLNGMDMIVIFILVLSIMVLLKNRSRKYLALTTINCLSFIATLSWYILAVRHSFFHGHMYYINPMLFNMPFTLIFVAWLAYSIYLIISDLILKTCTIRK